MKELIPWYIGGPLIGLMVPLLLVLREKQLGISSTFRYVGSLIMPKVPYLNYKRSLDAWQVQFALGIVASGVCFAVFDMVEEQMPITDQLYTHTAQGIYEISNAWLFIIGGVFIGFGSRYAGGCTAGHCIMGNSMFSIGSLVATVGFFIGGLIVSHFVLPYFL